MSVSNGQPGNQTTFNNAFISRVTTTDNAITRYNGTSGQVQNSGATVNDSGVISAPGLVAEEVTITGLEEQQIVMVGEGGVLETADVDIEGLGFCNGNSSSYQSGILDSQTNQNIFNMTVDASPPTGNAVTSCMFLYEITRGSSPILFMRTGIIALRFMNGTWELEDTLGNFDTLEDCGVSFDVTTASDVGQVTYTSGAEGDGQIKFKRIGFIEV